MRKFDIFIAEEKYRKISKSIHGDNYGSQQLFDLVVFYEELLAHNDSLLIESYSAESYDLLISLLEHFTPFGKPIELSERILLITENIKFSIKTKLKKDKINALLVNIRKELNWLIEFLNGKKTKEEYSSSIAFPLIENSDIANNFGVIDTLSILLSANTNLINDEFSIIPSLPKLEKKIENQLLNSWKFAKSFLSIENDNKIPKFKIVIEYNKRIGFYTGDSNGIALTLGFIIELAKYLNLRKIYEVNNNAIFTGLVDSQGVIGEISNEIIEKKIRIAFYSKYHCIVIPQNDYLHAEKILISEKKKYPKREIRLIPVNNINEIIYNTKLTNIAELNSWNFYLKKINKNKFNLVTLVAFALTIVIVLLLSYSIPKENQSIENEVFLEYAAAEYGLEIDKIAPIKNIGEIFNLKFDKIELDTQKSSKILNFKNIELVENRFGESEKAFRFNGINSFVELRNKKQLKIEFPISISIWVRKLDDDFGWLFTNNFDTSNYYGVFFGFISKNIPSIHYGNGGTLGLTKSRRSLYSTSMVDIGKWNHIVGIINSSDSLSLYLNSKKTKYYSAGEAKEIKYSDGSVNIGKFSNSKIFPVVHYNGDMDDFKLFNRSLTQEEIDLLFHEK